MMEMPILVDAEITVHNLDQMIVFPTDLGTSGGRGFALEL